MSQPFPIIQSLSHGGLAVPAEVVVRLAIDDTTIYNDPRWLHPAHGNNTVVRSGGTPNSRMMDDIDALVERSMRF